MDRYGPMGEMMGTQAPEGYGQPQQVHHEPIKEEAITLLREIETEQNRYPRGSKIWSGLETERNNLLNQVSDWDIEHSIMGATGDEAERFRQQMEMERSVERGKYGAQ